jgi:hypothetical protein
MQEYEDLKALVAAKPKAETRRQEREFASKCRRSNRLFRLFAAAFLKSGQFSKSVLSI